MRLTIQTKLLAILLAIGVPTLVAMGILGYANGQRTIRNLVRENLIALNATKARHLESYFTDLRRNVGLVASDRTVEESLKRFAATSQNLPDAGNPTDLWTYFDRNYPPIAGGRQTEPADAASARHLQEIYVERNPFPIGDHDRFDGGTDGSPYTAVHKDYHPYLRNLQTQYAVNNILLVDAATRRIVYAVKKNADFQASLDSPLLQGTNLRETANRALKGETNLVDFQRFAPAFNYPVAYVSVPIRDADRADRPIIGCVVAQIRIEEIDRIVSGEGNWAAEGLGKTGDSYVLGTDGFLRSDLRVLREEPVRFFRNMREQGVSGDEVAYMETKRTSVLAFQLKTTAAKAVAERKQGFEETRSFTGVSIFAAYAPLAIDGLQWGIVSRRNTDETLSPVNDFRRNALFTSLAVLLVIAGVAYPLARSFVAPIQAMSAAARRFGKGERGIRLAEAHRDDEFGEMARQFNAMVEDSDRQEKIQQGIRRNIVHDLKTPVTVIKGMGETLMFPEMAEDPTWRDEMVRAIVEQSDRLLDDLKDILQPIGTDYRPDLEEFDLSLVVERVVKSEKHTSRAADHLLALEGTDFPMMILGDRRKLRRVYENLLSNAIKYSPGNGKRVVVTLAQCGEDEVAVSFRDEGLGLTPEQLDRVLSQGGRVDSH
ncbi:sensor histidine kinase, partial [bacterium]